MTRPHLDQGQPIILIKRDFQRLLNHVANHEPVRNQLIIDLPTQLGLRTREMRMLRWHDIDVETGQLSIVDAKNKHIYPLPLPYSIAEKLERYCEYNKITRDKGYVLRRLSGCGYSHAKKGVPLRNETLWKAWHSAASRAGVENPEIYTPRLGRHYFAAMWNKQQGNLEVLRRILRHKELTYTQIYLSRLTFFEDIQDEYKRVHGLPIAQAARTPFPQQSASFEWATLCLMCAHYPVCRHKEAFSRDEAAAGCKWFLSRKKLVPQP